MSKILILLAFFGLASSGTFMALDRANAFPGGGGNGTTCSGLQCKKDDGCDLLRGTYTFWHQSKYCENGPAPGKCVESPTKKACYDDTYYKLGQCNSGKVIGNDSYIVTYCTGTVTDQPENPSNDLLTSKKVKPLDSMAIFPTHCITNQATQRFAWVQVHIQVPAPKSFCSLS